MQNSVFHKKAAQDIVAQPAFYLQYNPANFNENCFAPEIFAYL